MNVINGINGICVKFFRPLDTVRASVVHESAQRVRVLAERGGRVVSGQVASAVHMSNR